MVDINSRIGNLSPEKRKLLEMILQQQRGESNQKIEAGDGSPQMDITLIEPVKKEDLDNKQEIKKFYNSVNEQLNSSPFGDHSFFLNYGYAPNDSPRFSQIELPEIFMNKNPTQLVLEVIADCRLEDNSCVLDVGCGRGGTINVFKQFFVFKHLYGMDLSSQAIAFCRKTHACEQVDFLEGNAEKLPFQKNRFNIVTNIESSHGYSDVVSFWKEIFRVLKPGGHFLYTDLFPTQTIVDTIKRMEAIGLKLLRQTDITGNVLLSCDEISNTHAKAYSRENDLEFMGNFLAQPNSPVYNEMKSGKSKYMIFKLQKTQES